MVTELKNLVEEEVHNTIKLVMKTMEEDICDCDRCTLDIMAIALNSLKPKYVVTEKGQLYSKLDLLSYQTNADTLAAVTKAIEIVRKNHHHD